MSGRLAEYAHGAGTLRSLLVFLLMVVNWQAFAASVTLLWDPPTTNPEPNGYFVYYGPDTDRFSSKINVGGVTSFTVTGLVEGAIYHFNATAYDQMNRESGLSNTASAMAPYSAPTADFSISTTSGTAPVLLNFMNNSTGGITSYAWDFGDGTTSVAANPAHAYLVPGTYTVSLTVIGPGGSDTLMRSNLLTITGPAPGRRLYRSPAAPMDGYKDYRVPGRHLGSQAPRASTDYGG